MRQARRVQPTPIPAFAPLERPVALLVGASVFLDAATVMVVGGVGDDCDMLLLLVSATCRAVEVGCDDCVVPLLLVSATCCVVEGGGDDCVVLLLLMLVMGSNALLKSDRTEDGNSGKPGLVTVLMSSVSVLFKAYILNFWFHDISIFGSIAHCIPRAV